MATVLGTNLLQAYKNEYLTWDDDKKLQDAKRQEYLRRNPDSILGHYRQRAKILLYAADIMDKSVSLNSDHLNTLAGSVTNMGLGYAAVFGAGCGLLVQSGSLPSYI